MVRESGFSDSLFNYEIIMDILIANGTMPDGDRSLQRMYINGDMVLTVIDLTDCPEDATIGRSLVNCKDVVMFMKLAYEAGLAGVDFNVRFEENETYDGQIWE